MCRWVNDSGVKLVAKPDQLIKRRGKAGLLALNKTFAEARTWVEERAGKVVKVCKCLHFPSNFWSRVGLEESD